jgi:hypothetical protein
MDFITCHGKKSNPKIGLGICLKCRHAKRCPDLKEFVQPSLFPRTVHTPRPKRSSRKRSLAIDRQEVKTGSEQISLLG